MHNGGWIFFGVALPKYDLCNVVRKEQKNKEIICGNWTDPLKWEYCSRINLCPWKIKFPINCEWLATSGKWEIPDRKVKT